MLGLCASKRIRWTKEENKWMLLESICLWKSPVWSGRIYWMLVKSVELLSHTIPIIRSLSITLLDPHFLDKIHRLTNCTPQVCNSGFFFLYKFASQSPGWDNPEDITNTLLELFSEKQGTLYNFYINMVECLSINFDSSNTYTMNISFNKLQDINWPSIQCMYCIHVTNEAKGLPCSIMNLKPSLFLLPGMESSSSLTTLAWP